MQQLTSCVETSYLLRTEDYTGFFTWLKCEENMHILVQLKTMTYREYVIVHTPSLHLFTAHISLTLYPWHNLRQNSANSLSSMTTKERNYLYNFW